MLQGYGKLRAAAYVVLEVTDAERSARLAARRCSRRSPSARRGPRTRALNVAFTARRAGPGSGLPHRDHRGLLPGVPRGHDERPPQPAARRRGRRGPGALDLGRTRRTGGARPAPRLRPDEDGLAESLDRAPVPASPTVGCARWPCLDTADIGRGEHFGFRDGLSQPDDDRGRGAGRDRMHTVAPGEFLLGYLNEHGQYSRSPLVPAAGDDPGGPAARSAATGTDAAFAPVAPGAWRTRTTSAATAATSWCAPWTRTSAASGGSWTRPPARPTGDAGPGGAHGPGRADGGPLAERCAADPLPGRRPARARRGQRLRLPRRGPARSRLPDRRARTAYQPT